MIFQPTPSKKVKDEKQILLLIISDDHQQYDAAGTFIDYRYAKKKPGFFPERWAPKAGVNSVNIYGVGLMHLMFTPNNTKLEQPINNDFPYAGAVLIHFSSWSYNLEKKYAIHSRIMAGMLGNRKGGTISCRMISCSISISRQRSNSPDLDGLK